MTGLGKELQGDADVIVIGSGFGGSVVASRLVEAGLSVLLLERGPWRDTLPVREAGVMNTRPLPRTGGMMSVLRSLHPPVGPKRGLRLNKSGFLDIWIGQGVKAVCTSGVGGGATSGPLCWSGPPKGSGMRVPIGWTTMLWPAIMTG